MTWTEWVDHVSNFTVAKVIGWFIGIMMLVEVLRRFKVWSRLKRFIATIDALSELPEKMRLLDEIHHEVRPNTGTSLNDAVRRVEAEVKLQGRQLSDQTGEIEKIREQLESGDAALSERVSRVEDTLNPGNGGPHVG